MSFNFVKHWPIQNLFNDKIFPIYSIGDFIQKLPIAKVYSSLIFHAIQYINNKSRQG